MAIPQSQHLQMTKQNEAQTVGGCKQAYILQYFDSEHQISLCFDNKPTGYIKEILENIQLMSLCKHSDRKHKAKFMCHQCYYDKRNHKKPTQCPHKNRAHHSRGLCITCYQKVCNKLTSNPHSIEVQTNRIIEQDDQKKMAD